MMKGFFFIKESPDYISGRSVVIISSYRTEIEMTQSIRKEATVFISQEFGIRYVCFAACPLLLNYQLWDNLCHIP